MISHDIKIRLVAMHLMSTSAFIFRDMATLRESYLIQPPFTGACLPSSRPGGQDYPFGGDDRVAG